MGLGYTAGDPASLETAVRKLASDAGLRAMLSSNALKLFKERFAPEVIYASYADFLQSLAKRPD